MTSIKDIDYAPDFRSGFEMAIIRMLMFMPFSIEQTNIENKKNIIKENNIIKPNNNAEKKNTEKDKK